VQQTVDFQPITGSQFITVLKQGKGPNKALPKYSQSDGFSTLLCIRPE
jgi:hypothetical protein